jgi:hypothetical protein
LKDGNMSGNLGKPPDNTTNLALPSSEVDVSEMSDAFNLPMSLKYHAMLQAAKNPEVTLRTDHRNIDKLVMAIGSLTTTINESRESEQKYCESK